MINYEQFQSIELRIAKVLQAERIEGSDKLMKLSVNLGEEERTIVAGIGKKYEPADLIGKQVAVVANLEPRSLMGIESNGMVLAADDDGPVLLCPDREVSPGARIK